MLKKTRIQPALMTNTVSCSLITFFLFCFFSSSVFADQHKIVIAVDATKPPMEYRDQHGNITGFEIDFIKEMAREAGFTPILQHVKWQGIFEGLAAGKYDAICASASITEERKQKFSFTEPYINIAQAVVVSEGSTIQTIENLQGKKIAAKIKTTSLKAAQQIKGSTILTFPVVELAMQALDKGEVDAVVCDGPVAAFYVSGKEQKGLRIATLLPSGSQEQYGMVVRKGDEKTLALLNKGIANVKRQLIDIELQKKWLAALFNIQ